MRILIWFSLEFVKSVVQYLIGFYEFHKEKLNILKDINFVYEIQKIVMFSLLQSFQAMQSVYCFVVSSFSSHKLLWEKTSVCRRGIGLYINHVYQGRYLILHTSFLRIGVVRIYTLDVHDNRDFLLNGRPQVWNKVIRIDTVFFLFRKIFLRLGISTRGVITKKFRWGKANGWA